MANLKNIMATMEDWKMALAGQDVDSNIFYDFIPRDGNDNFLKEAFISLPAGQTLIHKIQQLLEENDNMGMYVLPKEENRLPEEQLKNILST